MLEIQDQSIHLIVTSPPYNASKDYGDFKDSLRHRQYCRLLKKVLKECERVLVDGGRIFINVADIGRKPMISLQYTIQNIIFKYCRSLHLMANIIWYKGGSAFHNCAWGSTNSQTSPCFRGSHEYILGFFKNVKERTPSPDWEKDVWRKGEFELYSREEWMIKTANSKTSKHPCAFPESLPYRLIKLWSFIGDTVLDPFAGSGTTLSMAKKLKRNSIGYEINSDYCRLIKLNTDVVDQTTQIELDKYFNIKEFIPEKNYPL